MGTGAVGLVAARLIAPLNAPYTSNPRGCRAVRRHALCRAGRRVSRRASAASRTNGVGGKHFAEPIGDWPGKRASSSPAPRARGHGQLMPNSSPEYPGSECLPLRMPGREIGSESPNRYGRPAEKNSPGARLISPVPPIRSSAWFRGTGGMRRAAGPPAAGLPGCWATVESLCVRVGRPPVNVVECCPPRRARVHLPLADSRHLVLRGTGARPPGAPVPTPRQAFGVGWRRTAPVVGERRQPFACAPCGRVRVERQVSGAGGGSPAEGPSAGCRGKPAMSSGEIGTEARARLPRAQFRGLGSAGPDRRRSVRDPAPSWYPVETNYPANRGLNTIVSSRHMCIHPEGRP